MEPEKDDMPVVERKKLGLQKVGEKRTRMDAPPPMLPDGDEVPTEGGEHRSPVQHDQAVVASTMLHPPALPPAPNGASAQTLSDVLAAISRGEHYYGPLVFPKREAKPEKGKREEKAEKKAKETPVASAGGDAPITWPKGPVVGRDYLTEQEVENIIVAILIDTEIMDHATQPGVSRARLRQIGKNAKFDANRFGRFIAPLMIWFARSGVTVVANDKVRDEWSLPRPMVSDDRVVIRRLLWATPPPDGDAVKLAREAGLDSTKP